MVYRTNYTHPGFGEVTIASDGQSIVGLWMAGQKHFGGTVDGEMEIPYGQVRTYGDLAREIAQEDGKEKMSSQAVGGAVGHNPISVIIPCHRVVGANGSLTGYAGGLARKIWLLEHEGADMEGLFVPEKGTAL